MDKYGFTEYCAMVLFLRRKLLIKCLSLLRLYSRDTLLVLNRPTEKPTNHFQTDSNELP